MKLNSFFPAYNPYYTLIFFSHVVTRNYDIIVEKPVELKIDMASPEPASGKRQRKLPAKVKLVYYCDLILSENVGSTDAKAID